jgi:hypothetical protein
MGVFAVNHCLFTALRFRFGSIMYKNDSRDSSKPICRQADSRAVARFNLLITGQRSATQKATAHTIYRSQ